MRKNLRHFASTKVKECPNKVDGDQYNMDC